jgi:hypothetical protein
MSLFETAKYTVLKKETKKIELREYATFYLANTTVALDDKYNNGFNQVFNYISGENESRKKISMTTPVVSTSSDDVLTTGFVIPSKYASNAPKPLSDNIKISEMNTGSFLVIRFSGRWNKKNFDKYDLILKSFIKTSKYKIQSERYILRYQPPFIPSFFRRNEVMYRVLSNTP